MAWFKGSVARPVAFDDRTTVLLVNLGTPDAPQAGPVKRYLGQFLSDRRVVEACPWYWYPILFGPILTFRPRKTAKLYQAIWTEQGSPLMTHSVALATALRERYRDNPSVRVELAMTYGSPGVDAVIDRIQAEGTGRLVVLPLYPQYSGSTTGAVYDAVARALARWRRVPTLTFIADYCAHSAYLDAVAASVQSVWSQDGSSHLVFSNHGIPVKYVAAGDPYEAQVRHTNAAVAQRLGLAAADYSECFQSRFGPTEWLQPYTDDRLAALAAAGVRAVTVVTPSFAVDCLETLEEIGAASREKYLAAGGERFNLIPALNDSPTHVAALEAILASYGVHAKSPSP